MAGACDSGWGVAGVATAPTIDLGGFPRAVGFFGAGDIVGIYGKGRPKENQLPSALPPPDPRLSGLVLLDTGHGIDSTRFGTFRRRSGHEIGGQCNSVFHGLLKHLRWGEFDRLVAVHQTDSRVRRLTTKSQLVALLYGQLAGAASLREIVAGLQSHQARLYHLGGRPVHRLTLADANAHRPPAVFTELFGLMVSQANRHLRRALGDMVYLIR